MLVVSGTVVGCFSPAIRRFRPETENSGEDERRCSLGFSFTSRIYVVNLLYCLLALNVRVLRVHLRPKPHLLFFQDMCLLHGLLVNDDFSET